MISISGTTQVCMVIGDPVRHSMSPLVHNAAYEFRGIADKFVFVALCVKPESLSSAMQGVRALGIRGVSCTMPHKVPIMQYLNDVDNVAQKIGAVNTVVNDGGKLIGYNTDADGILQPLASRTKLAGKRVAVFGAGGAARAAVFELVRQGAEVFVFNRSADAGRKLAEAAGCKFLTPEEIAFAKECDILINTTSVGMAPDTDQSLVPVEYLGEHQIVFDAVYIPYKTRLLREARNKGAAVIYGTEMFVAQAGRQFELYTGEKAPLAKMEEVVKHFLKAGFA